MERDNSACRECGILCKSAEADVHHLLPRSKGGSDSPNNLITLCDGCHAAHHPNLSTTLARSMIEKWAVRLAKWLDHDGYVQEETGNFGPSLRLFGLDRFRNGQLPVIQAALAGHSVLVVSPTGFGKTLCFQFPALFRSSVTLVVSPLKALMGDQVAGLLRKKLPATFINSDLSNTEKKLRYELIDSEAYRFLYLAPERFFVKNAREIEQIKKLRPAFFVVDEAHCIDRWGKDFRQSYSRLGDIRKALGNPPILAFTATAGREMQGRILESLRVEDAKVFVRAVDRPNIALLRWQCDQKDRIRKIAFLLGQHRNYSGKSMIFVPTVSRGKEVQSGLSKRGVELEFYHSKHGTSWDREQLLKRFTGESSPEISTIICTNAFGMGLDVPDVRLVIHWQFPASMEDYLQEFGRAGRDGKPSIAVVFYEKRVNDRDAGLLKFMAGKSVENSGLDAEAARKSLQKRNQDISRLENAIHNKSCFRKIIVEYFEGPKKKIRRSIAQVIIEWLFSAAEQKGRKTLCCDWCDRRLVDDAYPHKFIEGALR
jgi:ATP-dependent DNA helicase RecQ